jgi:hypothetical protein
MTEAIAIIAAAVGNDVVAVESVVPPSPMRTRPIAARHRRTVNDLTVRSAHSPPLEIVVMIVIVTASASANVTGEIGITTDVPATGGKTSASVFIVLVEILVVAATSSITVKLVALPLQIVDAVGRATPRVWPAGQRSDTAATAVSGTVARVPDAADGNARRSQNQRRARRTRRPFILVARRERLRRIKLSRLYSDGPGSTTISCIVQHSSVFIQS